jgi:nickel/cobalt exporter
MALSVLTLGTSFFLGALDGISPGHGKSLIAAFVIGEKLSLRQVSAMVLSLLSSHFLLLLLMAFGLQYFFGGHQHVEWIEWVSPVLVILFGFYLLFRYYRQTAKAGQGADAAGASCSCGHHHGHHSHQHDQARSKGIRHASLSGFLLGLVPCPMAVSTLVLSFNADQFSSAVSVIAIYVLGMAIVLGTLTLLVFAGRQLVSDRLEQINRHVPVQLLSSLLVIGIGVTYLVLSALHVHTHVA